MSCARRRSRRHGIFLHFDRQIVTTSVADLKSSRCSRCGGFGALIASYMFAPWTAPHWSSDRIITSTPRATLHAALSLLTTLAALAGDERFHAVAFEVTLYS